MPSATNRPLTAPPTQSAVFIVITLLVFMTPATPYGQSTLSTFSDAYLIGAYASYNLRDGYHNFDDVDGYVHVKNANPFIFGVTVGKRISVDSPRLRFQAAVELGRGSVKDRELLGLISDETGYTRWETLARYSIYWTGGLLADAHFLFLLENSTAFISAGLGAHLTYFDIAEKVVASGEKVSDVSNGMRGAISPSVNLGCGVEYKPNGRNTVCILYNMRYWMSADYKKGIEAFDNMFPMGANYTEFFFSHSIQLQYLLPRRSN